MIYYVVYLENGGLDLESPDDITTVAKVEYDGVLYCDIVYDAGKPLTLKAIMDNGEETDGIWNYSRDYRYDPEQEGPGMEGPGWDGPGMERPERSDRGSVQGDTVTIDSLSYPMFFNYSFIDSCGNGRGICVAAAVENHFSARIAGEEDGCREVNIAANADGTYTLKADASMDDDSKADYRWYMYVPDRDPLIMGRSAGEGREWRLPSPRDELTVACPAETVTYYCEISDGYGSEAALYFHINLNGDLYGTSGPIYDEPQPPVGKTAVYDAAALLQTPDKVFEAVDILQKLVGLGQQE